MQNDELLKQISKLRGEIESGKGAAGDLAADASDLAAASKSSEKAQSEWAVAEKKLKGKLEKQRAANADLMKEIKKAVRFFPLVLSLFVHHMHRLIASPLMFYARERNT